MFTFIVFSSFLNGILKSKKVEKNLPFDTISKYAAN